MISRAFTCTGPYAILIAYGLKVAENRSHYPSPAQGRCAMSVSRRFNRAEWQNFMLWASKAMPPEMFASLPSWEIVSSWPGKIVATMDYEATIDAHPGEPWYEGYPTWWHLSRVKRLLSPIQCRGNVGMWVLPENVSKAIADAEKANAF